MSTGRWFLKKKRREQYKETGDKRWEAEREKWRDTDVQWERWQRLSSFVFPMDSSLSVGLFTHTPLPARSVIVMLALSFFSAISFSAPRLFTLTLFVSVHHSSHSLHLHSTRLTLYLLFLSLLAVLFYFTFYLIGQEKIWKCLKR